MADRGVGQAAALAVTQGPVMVDFVVVLLGHDRAGIIDDPLARAIRSLAQDALATLVEVDAKQERQRPVGYVDAVHEQYGVAADPTDRRFGLDDIHDIEFVGIDPVI